MRRPPGAIDPERRSLLARAKLTTLVGAHWRVGAFDSDPRPAMGGMAVKQGERGWVLVEDDAGRALGRALLWALRTGIGELHLLFSSDDDAASRAARRGSLFRTGVTVWRVTGTELSPVAITPLPPEPALDVRVQPYRECITSAGAEAVVEWGTLFGDVWGLEVARVEHVGGEPWLGIGVTKEDRLTHRMVWGDEPDVDAVASVVRQVREVRERGDLGHPLNRLSRERWLRSWLVREPSYVGASRLDPVSSSVPRPDDLRDPAPAAAVGPRPDGESVLVVCSVGFDSEAVPIAAELAHSMAAGGASVPRSVLVVPTGDDHPLHHLAAGDSVVPIHLARIPDDWAQRCRDAAQAGRDDEAELPVSGGERPPPGEGKARAQS